MLAVPYSNHFGWNVAVQSTVQNNPGITVTPGNNTKGSYTQLLTALANEAWMVEVFIAATGVSAQIKDGIWDIGVDPAGGTAYSVLIPDLMLAGSESARIRGAQFYFPVKIPAGATVACRGSVNNATPGTASVFMRVWGKPSRPELCWRGETVTAYGVVAASSRGTVFTCGTSGAKGSYTSLGTTSKRHFWWQLGFGIADTTWMSNNYWLDLAHGDVTNKDIILPDVQCPTSTTELMQLQNRGHSCYKDIKEGDELFIRGAAHSGTLDTDTSAVAYGVT